MTPPRVLFVVGTRPEAIKIAPVLQACRRASAVEPILCFTGQHREMLAQVADYFQLQPDLNLDLMAPDQSLATLTARCVEGLDRAIERFRPDCVVGQGDTTTAMAASLAAFYRRCPFVHVEAGLRTGDMQAPWPEELNRRIAGLTAALHCAPTRRAARNLRRERVPAEAIHVTGNTVIDALMYTVARERRRYDHWQARHSQLGNRRTILITGHRRENFGAGLEAICSAIATLADTFAEVEFVYPVHLNGNVREPVFRKLGSRSNIRLLEPVPYPEFVWLMDRSCLILTDSGGVQEEAPSLGKPVLVMRETTERQEAVDCGAARLVGTSTEVIIDAVSDLLTDADVYAGCQVARNPYGDGKASHRIARLLATHGKALRWQPMTRDEVPMTME